MNNNVTPERHIRFWTASLITFVLLSQAFQPGYARELEDHNWIEVRTPNFAILSILGEKDTVELARYLESFRVAASHVTNIRRMDASIPINILALRRPGDFKKFGFEKAVGVFIPGIRNNTILIRDTARMSEVSIILHEYTHFLTRNHGGHLYPRWFDEGFAEYLGATKKNQFGELEIGHVPEERRYSFANHRWVPMRYIISPKDYDGWNRERIWMFYSESWGLVHFLLNRKGRDTSFGEDMANYIQLVESGVEELAAFERAFGISAKELDTQVGRYLNAGGLPGFRMKIEQLLPDFQPEVLPVSRAQASLALAKLALRREKLELAKRWYEVAASDESTRAHAAAGLGDVFKFQDEFDAARPHFETALELAPDDPYVQLDVAEYWHDLAEEPESATEQTELFERARSHYVKAWNLDDTIPETYAMFGLTYLNEGKNFDKAVEMLEQAEYLLPSNLNIRLWLAEAYMGAGRAADAESRARSVLAWSHGESEAAKRAKEILSGQVAGPD